MRCGECSPAVLQRRTGCLLPARRLISGLRTVEQSEPLGTVRAGEECQGHAGKDCGPVAVFSVRSPVADVRVCECVRVCVGLCVCAWGRLVICLSWQPNGHTLQSHIEMTLIEQII